MVYLGSPGIGKTYFCAALIPWIYGKVNNFRYWNERDLLSRIRSSISESNGDYLKEVYSLIDHDFVILDDLGNSGINDWRKEIILEFVDRRYSLMLPTVVTSNLTRKEIYDGFGPRIHSRLFAKENLIIENHEGLDLRQSGK